MKDTRLILPEFPSTVHLPPGDASAILDNPNLFIEEKVDGASCGMMLHEGHPVIRNRTHILNKGYLKDTPAKIQFRRTWGWFYENKECFEKLNKTLGYEVGVYGEWVYALHGIRYDKLPDLFIAYDLYDYAESRFIVTDIARTLLQDVGFSVPPLLHKGKVENWEYLENLCNQPSEFSTVDNREGIYLKITDGVHLTQRYKMVRSGYVQGCNWDIRKITKNKLAR